MNKCCKSCYALSVGEFGMFEICLKTNCECHKQPSKQSSVEAELLGAIGRGWCSKENEHKVMDSNLAKAILKEVLPVLEAYGAGERSRGRSEAVDYIDREAKSFIDPLDIRVVINDEHV